MLTDRIPDKGVAKTTSLEINMFGTTTTTTTTTTTNAKTSAI
jgi:hypothetical protein